MWQNMLLKYINYTFSFVHLFVCRSVALWINPCWHAAELQFYTYKQNCNLPCAETSTSFGCFNLIYLCRFCWMLIKPKNSSDISNYFTCLWLFKNRFIEHRKWSMCRSRVAIFTCEQTTLYQLLGGLGTSLKEYQRHIKWRRKYTNNLKDWIF